MHLPYDIIPSFRKEKIYDKSKSGYIFTTIDKIPNPSKTIYEGITQQAKYTTPFYHNLFKEQEDIEFLKVDAGTQGLIYVNNNLSDDNIVSSKSDLQSYSFCGFIKHLNLKPKYFDNNDKVMGLFPKINPDYCESIYKLKATEEKEKGKEISELKLSFTKPGILNRATFGSFGIPAYNSRIAIKKNSKGDIYNYYYEIIPYFKDRYNSRINNVPIRIEKSIDNKILVYNILNEKIYEFDNKDFQVGYLLTRKFNENLIDNIIYDDDNPVSVGKPDNSGIDKNFNTKFPTSGISDIQNVPMQSYDLFEQTQPSKSQPLQSQPLQSGGNKDIDNKFVQPDFNTGKSVTAVLKDKNNENTEQQLKTDLILAEVKNEPFKKKEKSIATKLFNTKLLPFIVLDKSTPTSYINSRKKMEHLPHKKKDLNLLLILILLKIMKIYLDLNLMMIIMIIMIMMKHIKNYFLVM